MVRTVWTGLRLLSTLCLVAMVIGFAIVERPWSWADLDWNQSNESTRIAWVDTDALNLRAEPTTSSEILDVLSQGTRLTVSGEGVEGFVPVVYNGETGWISETYLGWGDSVAPESGFFPSVAIAAEPDAERDPEPPISEPTRVAVERAPEPEGENWIDVDRGTAMVTLFIGDQAQGTFKGKIGRDLSEDGFYSTAVGTYFVYTMNPGLTSTPFVDDVYMTEFVGFDPDRHNGFHSPIRDAQGELLPSQNATTLGCVRLEVEAARQLYAFAYIGMRVEVHN